MICRRRSIPPGKLCNSGDIGFSKNEQCFPSHTTSSFDEMKFGSLIVTPPLAVITFHKQGASEVTGKETVDNKALSRLPNHGWTEQLESREEVHPILKL